MLFSVEILLNPKQKVSMFPSESKKWYAGLIGGRGNPIPTPTASVRQELWTISQNNLCSYRRPETVITNVFTMSALTELRGPFVLRPDTE